MRYKEIEAHSSHVSNVKFDKSGRSIFSVGFNGEIREWDVKTLKLLREYTGHTKTVNDLLIDDTGRKLISISGDGNLKIWDRASKREMHGFLFDKKGLRSFVKVSEKGIWITTSSQKLIFFDLEKLEATKSVKLKFKTQGILDFNKEKNILAIGGLGNIVQLVNAENGALIQEVQAHEPAVTGLRFLNEKQYISLGYHGDISVVDFENRTELDGKTLNGENFWSIALDSSKRRVSVSSAYKVSLLDVPSLKIIDEFETTCKGNYGLAFSPSDHMLALASADKKVRIWDFGE